MNSFITLSKVTAKPDCRQADSFSRLNASAFAPQGDSMFSLNFRNIST